MPLLTIFQLYRGGQFYWWRKLSLFYDIVSGQSPDYLQDLLPITNEVIVSVRVFLESNQTLIRHIIISFIHITETGSVRDRAMVLNATFSNISAISWRAVLLVEEAGVSGENHRPVASHWQILSHNVVSSTSRHQRDSNSQLYEWYRIGKGFVLAKRD
jgi:hypothetical protein